MAVVVVCSLVNGCGHADPRPARSYVGRDSGFQRLALRKAKVSPQARYRIDVPVGTQSLLLRADCKGGSKGARLQMGVTSLPTGSVPCDGVGGHGGVIALGGDPGKPDDLRSGGLRTVTVKAPQGATWSIAADSTKGDRSVGHPPG